MTIKTPTDMRRTKTGALIWKKPGRVKANTPIPDRTLASLAGCRVLGLRYWGDAPPPSTVWALDDDRQAHLVHLDRNASVATHKSACRLGCTRPSSHENWRTS